MPIYEYRCTACGHEFEEWQKMSDAPIRTCPACKARKVDKLISHSSFQLKGSGWYATDYGKRGTGSTGTGTGTGTDGGGKKAKADKDAGGTSGTAGGGGTSGGGGESSGGESGGGAKNAAPGGSESMSVRAA